MGNHVDSVRVIDSHTGGEPTRVIVEGGPRLRGGTVAEMRDDFAAEHTAFQRAVIGEPRGNDILVGALAVEPSDPSCAAGVIFFNNAGCLKMCGHGMMGFMVSLGHLGKLGAGKHRVETPVGVVAATLGANGAVAIENVASYREAKGVVVEVAGHGEVRGDVAWGGNWFFLAHGHGLELTLDNVAVLTEFASGVRRAVNARFPEVDHIELVGPPRRRGADAKNFVLCPGGAYDRSPCGTGTSAVMACRFADGELHAGQTWRQEGIIGSVFEGTVRPAPDGEDGAVVPTVQGTAFVNAEAELVFDPDDPYCWGIL